MPKAEQYLVRREADGTMRTIVAHSVRGAMQIFLTRYTPPPGEFYLVKKRGEGEWERYKVS